MPRPTLLRGDGVGGDRSLTFEGTQASLRLALNYLVYLAPMDSWNSWGGRALEQLTLVASDGGASGVGGEGVGRAQQAVYIVPVNDAPTIGLPGAAASPTSSIPPPPPVLLGSEDTALPILGLVLGDVDSEEDAATPLCLSIDASPGSVSLGWGEGLLLPGDPELQAFALRYAPPPIPSPTRLAAASFSLLAPPQPLSHQSHLTVCGRIAALQAAVAGGSLVYHPPLNLHGTTSITLTLTDNGATDAARADAAFAAAPVAGALVPSLLPSARAAAAARSATAPASAPSSASLLLGGPITTTAVLFISLLPINDPPAFSLPLHYLQQGLLLPAQASEGTTAHLHGVCPFDVDSNATLLRVCVAVEVGLLSFPLAAGVVAEAGSCRQTADPATWWYHSPAASTPPLTTVAAVQAVTLWGTSAALCDSLEDLVYTPPLAWYAAPLWGEGAGISTTSTAPAAAGAQARSASLLPQQRFHADAVTFAAWDGVPAPTAPASASTLDNTTTFAAQLAASQATAPPAVTLLRIPVTREAAPLASALLQPPPLFLTFPGAQRRTGPCAPPSLPSTPTTQRCGAILSVPTLVIPGGGLGADIHGIGLEVLREEGGGGSFAATAPLLTLLISASAPRGTLSLPSTHAALIEPLPTAPSDPTALTFLCAPLACAAALAHVHYTPTPPLPLAVTA